MMAQTVQTVAADSVNCVATSQQTLEYNVEFGLSAHMPARALPVLANASNFGLTCNPSSRE